MESGDWPPHPLCFSKPYSSCPTKGGLLLWSMLWHSRIEAVEI